TTTDWHNIVVRNKLAEICEKYLSKGDKVYIEGKLKNKQWEQDGVKRYATEVIVTEMTMLSTQKNSENNPHSPQQNTPTKGALKTAAPKDNNDIPF
ncbi:single-stranded DNA-binding protein, partial [Polaribacter sp.]|nr:single-stranded DNA-binding protein [Polaribacter sp.]